MKLWIATLIFGAVICASQPYPIGGPGLIGAAQYGQYSGGYVPKSGFGTTPYVNAAPLGAEIGQTAIPGYGFGGYNTFGGLGAYGAGGFGKGGFSNFGFSGGFAGLGGKGGYGGFGGGKGGYGGFGGKHSPPPPPAPFGGPGHKGGGPGVFVNAPIYVAPPVYQQQQIPVQPKVQQQPQQPIYYQPQQQPIIQQQPQPIIQQQPVYQQPVEQPVYQQPVQQKQPEVIPQQPQQPQQPIEQPPAPQPQVRLPCPVLTSPTQTVEPMQNMPDNSVMHRIVFEPNHAALNLPSPDWVDLHYSINQDTPLPWQMNYRMQKASDNEFVHPGILLRPGDKINYGFTYCILGGVDCDTGISEESLPAPQPVQQKQYQPEPEPVEEEWPQVPCPAIDYQQGVQIENADMNSYRIIFRAITDRPVDWVDLHFSINPTPADRVWQTNVRMALSPSASKMFEWGNGNIILRPGDSITYSFTYCSQHVDCNTPLFTFGVPQPVQQKIYQQPVIVQPQPQPVITTQKQQTVSAPPAVCPVIQFNANVEAMGTAVNGGAIPHKINFAVLTMGRGMDWVDLHYSIGMATTGWAMNLRMRPMEQTAGGMPMFESPSPINLMPGDVLRYAFTYCSQGVDCDTSVMTFTVPQTVITTTKSQTHSLPAPQTPIINTATGVINIPSVANCNPVQFTHRALNYIDQEGSPKIRLFFLANANANIDKVTVKYLACTANSCPSNVATVPESSWQVTRQMYAKENLAQGFELTNVPALQPGMKMWYGFVYERTGQNMRCPTEAYIRDYQQP